VHKLVAQAFLNHTIDKYTTVIDHIDNNPSNNIVENLRVVTSRENTSKHHLLKYNKSSKYTGVIFDKIYKNFISGILIENKHFWLYTGKDEIKASETYKDALLYYTNFGYNKFVEKYKHKTSSQYKGVYLDMYGKYRAQAQINGKNKYLGTFKTEIEAYLKAKEFYK
jgi:hypothetical protein